MIFSFPLSMRFTGRLFTAVGICLFAAALYFAVNTIIFISSSVEAAGSIVDYIEEDEAETNGVEKKVFYPVIEFMDREGQPHRFRSEVSMDYEVWVFIKARESGFTNSLYKVPEIKVRFNPENPSETRTARSFIDLWHAEFALGILSVIFLFVGLTLLHLAGRSNQKPHPDQGRA